MLHHAIHIRYVYTFYTHTHTFASEILTEFFRVVTGNITLEMVSTTHPTRSPQPGPGSHVPPAWCPSAGSAISFLTVCVRGVKVDCEPQEIGSLKRLCISNGREETNLLQVTYPGRDPCPPHTPALWDTRGVRSAPVLPRRRLGEHPLRAAPPVLAAAARLAGGPRLQGGPPHARQGNSVPPHGRES